VLHETLVSLCCPLGRLALASGCCFQGLARIVGIGSVPCRICDCAALLPLEELLRFGSVVQGSWSICGLEGLFEHALGGRFREGLVAVWGSGLFHVCDLRVDHIFDGEL
jgi:hypothetical protein